MKGLDVNIKDFIKDTTSSKFAKNTLVLAVGTTIAQILPLAIYPILGRIYSPEQFGILASLTSIISIITVISTGQYQLAVLVSDNDTEAANVTMLSLWMSLIFMIVLIIPFYFFNEQLGDLCGNRDMKLWVLICPVSAFFINFFSCYNEWCVRKSYYKSLASNKITNSSAVTLGKLAFGFTVFKNFGLVIGDVLGRFITAIGCVVRVLIKDRNVFRAVSYRGMRDAAKKFLDFPRLTMPAQLINTIGGSIAVLIISAYFTSKEAGYFAMTQAVLGLPITVVSKAICDVFRQKANEIYSKGGCFVVLYVKVLKILSFVTITVLVIVVFFLPWIFSFVLGGQWRIAGVYAQILLPMNALDFVASSLAGVLIVVNKLKVNFWWQVYYTCITIVSLIIGCIILNNVLYTLMLYSIGLSSAYLLQIYLNFRCSKLTKEI